MKRTLYVCALCCVVLVGAGCPDPPVAPERCDPTQNLAEPVESGFDIDNQEDCEAANGVWRVHGIRPEESCNIRATDAGEECCDRAQCEGECLDCADDTCTVGTCSELRAFFGCAQFWTNGEIEEVTICVD